VHYALTDYLLDLVQNSLEAGASVVRVSVSEADGRLEAAVLDNGSGMDGAEVARATDPFHTDGNKHPGRKVGLGLPFLIQALDQAGGRWDISSARGRGTDVRFWFPLDGVDTPPVGDLPGCFLSCMCFDGDYELVAARHSPGRGSSYEVRRSDILDAVGPLSDAASIALADAFLRSQEEVE